MNKLQRQQERRRKFHESLVNILYAPPPSPPPPPPPPPQVLIKNTQNDIPEDQLQETTLDVQHITDELGEEKSSSSSSDDDTESDPRKLTRAQRKRLRKKRLKEASLNRRKIIGPELPSSTDLGSDHLHSQDGDAVVTHHTQGVRRNAGEGLGCGTEQQLGHTSSCTSQNKRKQRRVSRKLAKERLKPLTVEVCDPPTCPDTNNET